MALTGFDPTVVNASINAVKSAYDALMDQLATNMQSQFVEGMADKWACNQAQTFFNSHFKPAIDGLIKDSDAIFESIVQAMNSAAQAWANETESSYSSQSFSPLGKTMDVSSIQENIGGVRGIDVDQANPVAAKLTTISTAAAEALDQARSAVNSCGFMGGGQAEALQESLNTVKQNLSSSTSELADSVKSAINDTVATYSDTAGRIQQAFSA